MDTSYRASVLLSLLLVGGAERRCVYLSQGGVGEDGGPGSMADSVGKSTALWLQLGKLLVHGGQCREGQRAAGSSAGGLKLQRARRRGLWAHHCHGSSSGGAHFGALPSLSEVLWSSCCPRICQSF